MISLFVEGTMNVLKHHGILAGPLGRIGKDVGVFIGNSALPILATQGGLVEHLVKSMTRSKPDRRWPSSGKVSAKWSRNLQAAWPER
jgi:uncharacterized protein